MTGAQGDGHRAAGTCGGTCVNAGGRISATGEDLRFGELLRRWRVRAGLSQEDLAERSGVSLSTVSGLERGRRRAPQPGSAKLLADALGLSGEERATFFATIESDRVAPGRQPRAVFSLPAAGAPILGRDRELAEIARLFDGGARLVTLLGPGGVGKTRLALQVAWAESRRMAIWTGCELLASSAEVMPAAMRAAEAPERPGMTPVEQLARAVQGRPALLVLDNLEHLIDVAGEIASLLEAAPDLRVLTTSREALALKREAVRAVPPLPVPAGETGAALRSSPGVALFGRSTPEGSLPDADLAAAARVVTLLDGLPLAIELAAARRRALSVEAIAGLLEQVGLPALGQWREGVARFRTFEAAVRWSTDLLPPDARRLMRTLAAFRGGFTAGQAADLAARLGAPGLAAELPALLDASIVRERASGGPDGALGTEPRYSMLEPVRLAAQADLEAAGETRAARDAHLGQMTDLAARASAGQLGPDAAAALAEFARERANLIAALEHACATGQAGPAIRLANALGFWWDQIGGLREANLWLPRVLALDDGLAPARARWLLRWLASQLAMQAGEYERQRSLADEAMAIAREAGDREGQAMAEIALALWLQTAAGRLEESLAGLDRAIALSEGSDHWLAEGYGRALRAAFRLYGTGETERPLAVFGDCRRIFRRRAPHLSQVPLVNLSVALQATGRHDEALAAVREALALNETFANPLVQALGAWRLAVLLSEEPAPASQEAAARMLGVSDWLLDWYGYAGDQMMRQESDAARERLAGALGPGLEAAIAEGRALAEREGAGLRLLEIALPG
ncbi:MAG: ATP-binding protein [Chloroflexota bacterium]